MLTDVLDADQQEGHDGGHKGRHPLARLPQGKGQQGDVGDDEAGGVPLRGGRAALSAELLQTPGILGSAGQDRGASMRQAAAVSDQVQFGYTV